MHIWFFETASLSFHNAGKQGKWGKDLCILYLLLECSLTIHILALPYTDYSHTSLPPEKQTGRTVCWERGKLSL